MSGPSIGTSSYSEAMDLSDLDGYEPKSPSPALTEQSPEPVKIRKKPGRKPNPASPALRKAQNRAAQRAFRERKERHMKDLESDIRRIKEVKDKLEHDNSKLKHDNEILKAENWYLKGIVLSLQLVCLQHNLVIPQHCPHVDKKTLSVLAQSIPASISSYLNVSSRNKLDLSQGYQGITPAPDNSQSPILPDPYQQQVTPNLPQGSLIITQDGVETVKKKKLSEQQQQYNNNSDHAMMTDSNNSNNNNNNNNNNNQWYQGSSTPESSSNDNLFSNIPPLSPMSEHDRPLTEPQIIPAPTLSEPATSNIAAIQALRLRLRLQSACVRMQSVPFAIQPTLLQLTIPHDPRIDLIPTPHMRDRMILYRDQFDLDDCFRCLLSGSVFHGGDPAIAGNWQLPAEFFEKYWFLTIDYNLRRCTNEWRKKQGLKELEMTVPNEPIPLSLPTTTATLNYDDLSNYLGVQFPPSKQSINSMNQNRSSSSGSIHSGSSSSINDGNSGNIMPIQLTNGYGTLQQHQQQQQQQQHQQQQQQQHQQQQQQQRQQPPQQNSQWQNLMMGTKNYDMMMTGLYQRDAP